jgi:hypothetical protein
MPPLGALTQAWRNASTGALLVALCLAVAGCFPSDQYSVISIENRTETTVDVFMVEVGQSDGSRVVSGIEPGTSYPFSNIVEGCSDVELVAKDESGAEVARSPTPVCRPSTWVVER